MKINSNYILIFSFFALISFFIFFKSRKQKRRSNDNKVQNLIDLIDNSLSKIGTFNSDHDNLDYPLSQLTRSQIIKLHKDFGYRYYNPIFKMYGLTNIGSFGISEKKDLNSLFYSELDENQIKRLNDIYKSKNLSFPLLTN